MAIIAFYINQIFLHALSLVSANGRSAVITLDVADLEYHNSFLLPNPDTAKLQFYIFSLPSQLITRDVHAELREINLE